MINHQGTKLKKGEIKHLITNGGLSALNPTYYYFNLIFFDFLRALLIAQRLRSYLNI